MLTFTDFTEAIDKSAFIRRAIAEHTTSDLYRVAIDADLYDKQRNVTVSNYVRTMFTLTGTAIEDFTASNNKIASNFYNRLNTQRCTYSLGNGVTFTRKKQVRDENGAEVTVDLTKEQLGPKFDTDLRTLGYYALIHGVSFGFWNVDRLHVFPVTEFVPLWDEYTGVLRAGIRFWRLDCKHPLVVVLYEEDGYTKYAYDDGDHQDGIIEPKRSYKTMTRKAPADPEEIVVGEENYSGALPVIPMWGSRLKQSTLVGMREAIDSFDLIRSGFANDLSDCAQIYWIVENCGGMSDEELGKFRDRLKINHIATVDSDGGGGASPYTQEIPYQARQTYLDAIRAGIYEDFGGLDVHTVAAGATNDHIQAAYQPMDENADDFEYQIIGFVQTLLALIGIEDTPSFKRNRISNIKEQVEVVMLEANYLDDETILQKLPNISPDEVKGIMARKINADAARMDVTGGEEEPDFAND